MRDRALLHTIVYGTLRWRLRLEDVIEQASRRRMVQVDRELRGPLRVAAYQLLYLDRVPAHAIVHEAVSEARRRTHQGGGSFVNAVLRKIAVRRDIGSWPVEGDLATRLSIETSHPLFLVERWLARWGEEATRRMLDASNRPKPTHLLAFTEHGGRDGLQHELAEAEVETRLSEVSPLGLVVTDGDPRGTMAFREGRAYIQDEAAQAAALVPSPRRNERIFDAAAAPGGKSFALVAAEPTARVIAADRDVARLTILTENLTRLGRRLPILAASAARPALAPGFDRVVVDYPCTGTGTLRKHPELKWRVDPKEIDRLASAALRLIDGVAPLVRLGGLVIGISCSMEPEENEGWVEEFLGEHADFERAELDPDDLSSAIAPHLVSPGLWQLPPGADHDGLTANVLRRSR